MEQKYATRRLFLGALLGASSLGASSLALAQQPAGRVKEPVFRVANANTPGAAQAEHPLDPALARARMGLKNIRENVKDYTFQLVKRERVKGVLGEPEYMFGKIRNRKVKDGKVVSPFSVYLKFLKPESVNGREVLYVEGRDNGKMLAHEATRFLPSIWLRPKGPIAMRGNLYPLTEIGIETLIVRLIEKGTRDRNRGECEVQFRYGANINGRKCTVIEVLHPTPRKYFDFHMARIFIDDELNVPIRYAAYGWPKGANQRPPLLEEYTYLKLKLNVGLTDADFSSDNPEFNF